MKVKIKATGMGATALRDGTIIHFDPAEAKAKNPDKRKLEAEVDIEDARRIKELGWADFTEPKTGPVTDRAELGDDVAKLEQAPPPEQGAASRQDLRDDDGEAEEEAAPARRPAAKRKPAAPRTAKRKPAAPAQKAGVDQAQEPAADDTSGDAASGDDPEAGPA